MTVSAPSTSATPLPAPSRVVHQEEALAWLARTGVVPGAALVTSLPDVSEVAGMGDRVERWRPWFVEAARACIRAVPDDSVALFFQTDIKRDGEWVDKGFLVQKAAELEGAAQLFHKVVCRVPPGLASFGRPAWAHLLAFSRRLRLDPGHSTADVLPEPGEMSWARAMGIAPCRVACSFVKRETRATTVLDPFCGLGSALAVANVLGLDAIGVELSAKRAERARRLRVDPERWQFLRDRAERPPESEG